MVSWSCTRCDEGGSLHGAYLNGKRDGVWSLWRVNRTRIDEGRYVDGKRKGKWRGWHANGKPAFSRVYNASGIKHGPSWSRAIGAVAS
jgi:antitoxin component YwqK of YwqJK toxin-antitoxin module